MTTAAYSQNTTDRNVSVRPSRGARWICRLVIAAVIAGGIASFSESTTYGERLADLHASRSLPPDVYNAAGDSRTLRALLVDAAEDPELAFKMKLALDKYRKDGRMVLEAFGTDPMFRDLLRRFGEHVVPVVAYFMNNDIATLRVLYGLTRLRQAWERMINALPFRSKESRELPKPAEYDAQSRGLHAIERGSREGHHFLGQFDIDLNGVAHWNQTARVLESVEDFLLGGVRNLETKHNIGAPITVLDAAAASADVLTIFAVPKVLKFLRPARRLPTVAEEANALERATRLGSRVLANDRVGMSLFKLGAKAGTIYLVARYPSLLNGLFAEIGAWLGIPTWLAVALGWWAVVIVLSIILLPLLSALVVLIPAIKTVSQFARWLRSSRREQSKAGSLQASPS